MNVGDFVKVTRQPWSKWASQANALEGKVGVAETVGNRDASVRFQDGKSCWFHTHELTIVEDMEGDFRVRVVSPWSATIFVGSREGYDGEEFGMARVSDAIHAYQEASPEQLRGCVELMGNHYMFRHYSEYGYRVGLINYARFPHNEEELEAHAFLLAKHLFESLKQNRVSVVTPRASYMFEKKDAENNPGDK